MPALQFRVRSNFVRFSMMGLRGGLSAILCAAVASSALAGSPYATEVAFYDGGSGVLGPYTNQNAALGSPERFTGEGVFPQVVSMFNPAWGDNELTGVTGTGSLVWRFATAITNSPSNPFGVDLIIFGNGSWIDESWPNGQFDPFGSTFGLDQMRVSVSQNGVDFVQLGDFWEGLFPTQGFLDVGPYSLAAGGLDADFTQPMDPALTEGDFAGLNFAQAMGLYNGSGGGTPIDIASSGLASVSYVKVELTPGGANDGRLEIDGMAVVPEPATAAGAALLATAAAALRRRARSA